MAHNTKNNTLMECVIADTLPRIRSKSKIKGVGIPFGDLGVPVARAFQENDRRTGTSEDTMEIRLCFQLLIALFVLGSALGFTYTCGGCIKVVRSGAHTYLDSRAARFMAWPAVPLWSTAPSTSNNYAEKGLPEAAHPLSATMGEDSSVQQIDLLYDSECPICMMEVNFLQKRDINHRIKFTDLSSPLYNPAEHGNVQFKDGMRKIRAVLPDGEVVVGVEVFRKTYDAIGLGWVFGITKLPLIGGMADRLYDLWAENRLRLTGRPELAQTLVERAKVLREAEPIEECDDEGCGLDYDNL